MSTELPRPTLRELEDAFIKVSFEEDCSQSQDRLHAPWVDNASARHSDPFLFAADSLRKLHPGYSVVASQSSVLGFPYADIHPIAPEHIVATSIFVPLPRRSGVPGALVDLVAYGAFRVSWDNNDFIVYITKYMLGLGSYVAQFILHDGPEDPARNLLLALGTWQQALHDEIWVFNQGYWQKDSVLYYEIKKANWDDVILDETLKSALRKDVEGFFTSERIYKDLAIPWKRGLIMHGPPGNGKTISIKAIMKTCIEKGHIPLYIKSFTSFMGDEASMAMIFAKARSQAPCVMILEDLDSLITDRNRSFFLNQLDGLESNDGLLVIGTTNHFDRLDPGLSSRPSRFDRQYLFANPTRDERMLYVEYWQNKLKNNEWVSLPDDLRDEIVNTTEDFSFAYLKEAFVASLVLMAGYEGDRPEFRTIIRKQIAELRSQLDRQTVSNRFDMSLPSSGSIGAPSQAPHHILESELSSGSKIYRMEPSKSIDLRSLARRVAGP